MFPPYFFVAFFLLCLLIVFTYKVKNSAFRWFAIIFPPLCLIPIVFVPFDMFTIMIWLLGFVVALISAISVLVRVMRLRKIGRDKKDERHEQKIRLIRPILTVAIFCLAILCLRIAQASADNYAIAMGKQMHAVCNTQKKCPERVDGWERGDARDWYSSVILYGKFGPRFRITYSVTDDKESFEMVVKHNIDEGFTVYGGVNKPFKTKLWGPR